MEIVEVAAEVFAEKSILASEAQGLQSWLFDISEERKHFVSVIDEVSYILILLHSFVVYWNISTIRAYSVVYTSQHQVQVQYSRLQLHFALC